MKLLKINFVDPEDPLKHENNGDLEDPLKHENHSDPKYPIMVIQMISWIILIPQMEKTLLILMVLIS